MDIKKEQQTYLDHIISEYRNEKRSREVIERISFYRQMADKEQWETLAWAFAVPGAGHLYLHKWKEGADFVVVSAIIMLLNAYFICVSFVSLFVDRPPHWGIVVFLSILSAGLSIASMVRALRFHKEVRAEAEYMLDHITGKEIQS